MEEDLISVCLTLYKPKLHFLQELADGVRKQTLNSYELIISDNDDAEDMVKDVFKGINYKYFKNEGTKQIFFNVNNTINQSSGEYIQFLCQDDVMMPDMLQKQLQALQRYPDCGFVYTQVIKIDPNSVIINKPDKTGMTRISQEDLSNYLLVYGCLPGNLSTVMIKRSILLESGLFNTELFYAADFNLWIRLAQKCGMAINYDGLLMLRSHPEQASFTLPGRYFLKDMNINVRLLFKQSGFGYLKKYFYINSLYGRTIFVRLVNEFFKIRKMNSLLNLFRLRFPLSIFVIFPITLLYYVGIRFKFNFGEFSKFPLPVKEINKID